MNTKIIDRLNDYYRSCFSRLTPFNYFCLIVLALLCGDVPTLTEIIRIFQLDPSVYDGIIHFLNSTAYDQVELMMATFKAIVDSGLAKIVNGSYILIMDHTKISKEGQRMAGAKRHHQSSENISKPSTINGFHAGVAGIELKSRTQRMIAPFYAKVHEGSEDIQEWKGEEALSRTERLLNDLLKFVPLLDHDTNILCDRDFMNKNTLNLVDKYNENSPFMVHLSGRARLNTVIRKDLTDQEKESQRKPGV